MAVAGSSSLVVGVLALQGAFREHVQHIERLNPFEVSSKTTIHLEPILVRNANDLCRCSALIIPGGESTAIALGAQRAGLLEPLRDWIRDDKPTWGTCAGMILLAREATGGKKGGQELLGGIDIRVGRNGYGSQVDSFEEHLSIPALSKVKRGKGINGEEDTFPGIFIRAPIIESLLLKRDVLSVDPAEPTMVAREKGQAHEKLTVRPQERLDKDEQILASARPLLLSQGSSYSSVTSTSSTSSTFAQLAVAPPLEKEGQDRKIRKPLEILATLSHLPRGAKESIGGGGGGGDGGENDDGKHSNSSNNNNNNNNNDDGKDGIVGIRPDHDSMIVALKQGQLLCTSFHPELTNDSRLHDYFIRFCCIHR